MEAEILIIDDDEIAAKFAAAALEEVGFTTRILEDGRRALEVLHAERPKAALVDILMPGVDGLTLLRDIKADPELAGLKVIIVSGKDFKPEQERAARLGADLFVAKPYDVDAFPRQIIGVIGNPEHPGAPAPAGPKQTVEVKVWGCRSEGSASGGRTPCVSIEAGGQFIILDAGGGLAELSRSSAVAARKEYWILLTHFHPAHIEGLGLFAPSRSQEVALHIGGPSDPELSLDQCVRTCFEKSFAADPSPIHAHIRLLEFQADHYELAAGIRLKTMYANHPANTLAYALEIQGRKIVYCPDSELRGEASSALQDYDDHLEKFCRDADLLIHDARYSPEDYSTHKNQGHSSASDAAELAGRAGVSRLMLFHMDVSYGAAELEGLLASARRTLGTKNAAVDCVLAQEGLTLSL